MKVALIQGPLEWEKPVANRNYFQNKIDQSSNDIELFVLPEMFSSGFTMTPQDIAEPMDGPTVIWMLSIAKARNAAIVGSVVVGEKDKYFNRLLFVHPSGEIQHYDKRHLFSLAKEDEIYTAGKDKIIIEYLGWKICPLVCYDLRFPVFSRNAEDYDLLIYVANWPLSRIDAWNRLLPARSIENMCYTIGVNRTGEDQNENVYTGNSQVLDYIGDPMFSPSEDEEVFIVTLDKEKMLEARRKLGFLDDRDNFTVA